MTAAYTTVSDIAFYHIKHKPITLAISQTIQAQSGTRESPLVIPIKPKNKNAICRA